MIDPERGAAASDASATRSGRVGWVGLASGSPLMAAAWVLVAALASAAIGMVVEAPRRPSAPQTYVIPPGTGVRVRAGESVADVMPQAIETGVGVSLVVENRDTESHAVGPFALAPGQSWRRQFATAGTYGFSCSVYPTDGFTIDVAPAARLGVADAIRRVWLAAFVCAGALLVAAMAGRLAERPSPPVATETLRSHSSPSWLAAAWAGAATGLVPLGWVAATRVADWTPVLASRATGWLLGTAFVAVGAVLGSVRYRAAERGGPATLAMLGALGTATWWAFMPDLGALGAWRAALAVLGAGCLAAAALARRRSADPYTVNRLALAGGILALGSLPMPSTTPPVTAMLALPTLAASTAVAAVGWLGGRRFGVGTDHGGLVRAAAGTVALAQLVILWGALVKHVDAVALPLDGNPVSASEASIERGAVIWTSECAACHPSVAELASTAGAVDDRAALRLLTNGQGDMPGFAYRLDLTSRGDVLNFLRASSGD